MPVFCINKFYLTLKSYIFLKGSSYFGMWKIQILCEYNYTKIRSFKNNLRHIRSESCENREKTP